MAKKSYNNAREAHNLLKGATKTRKTLKTIVKELGERNISLEDIANEEKILGLEELYNEHEVTFNEAMILKAYSVAISKGDAKMMTFIRDSMGEKPSSTIDITEHKSPLENMTTEDLTKLLEFLRREEEGVQDE